MNTIETPILVTGACGQIGSELTLELIKRYGSENVIASDISMPAANSPIQSLAFEKVNVLDPESLETVISNYSVKTIVHLAAILSATGEGNPQKCWDVNINGTLNVFNLSLKHGVSKVFVPSSIAVWGDHVPKIAPQDGVLKPKTMYGVTKVTIELLADYYFNKFGLDCRGLRYPGIISSEAPPGGGTTDYAVEIFYYAVKNQKYSCFVGPETRLPMMYMPDCIKAAIDLLEAPVENLTHHCDYNVGAMSFTVRELAEEIRKHIPSFEIEYRPDHRQAIADSWPFDVDDSCARRDWGWKPEYDMPKMVEDMIKKLQEKYSKGTLNY